MDPQTFAPPRRTRSLLSTVTGTSTSSTPKFISFNKLFSNALLDYKKRTKEDLLLHHLASRLKNCDSPDTILPVLEEQTRAPDQPRSSDESPRQLRQLRLTVNVLYHLSQGIADRVDLVIIRLYPFKRCVLPFIFFRYYRLRQSSLLASLSSFQ